MNKNSPFSLGVLKVSVSFVLCLSLVAITGVLVLSLTFFSQTNALGIMEKNEYYTKVSDALLLKCSSYFDNAGVMQQMLPSIITKDTIKQEIAYTTNGVFNGTILRVNKDKEFEELKNEILQSLGANDIEVTPEIEATVTQLVQDSKRSYQQAIMPPYFDKMVVWNGAFKGATRYLVLAISIAFAVISWKVLQNLCNGKEKSLYIQSAFVGAGISFALPAILLLATGWAQSMFSNRRIYATIVSNYFNGVFWAFLWSGIVLSSVGVCYGIFSSKGISLETVLKGFSKEKPQETEKATAE